VFHALGVSRRASLGAAPVAAALLAWGPQSQGRVTRIVIDSTTPLTGQNVSYHARDAIARHQSALRSDLLPVFLDDCSLLELRYGMVPSLRNSARTRASNSLTENGLLR
jgi:hypothetical protein